MFFSFNSNYYKREKEKEREFFCQLQISGFIEIELAD